MKTVHIKTGMSNPGTGLPYVIEVPTADSLRELGRLIRHLEDGVTEAAYEIADFLEKREEAPMPTDEEMRRLLPIGKKFNDYPSR